MLQTRRALAHILLLGSFMAAASVATADPGSLPGKREQARQVLAQVNELDSRLNRAAEAYDAATWKLSLTRHALRVNRRELGLARVNLRRAQGMLANRLVAMYTSSTPSALEVILGARSLDELLTAVETSQSLSRQDMQILAQIKRSRRAIVRHRAQLSHARAVEAAQVARRAAERALIGRQLAERRRLLASVESEVAALERAERARQLATIREVRARLASQTPATTDTSVVGATAQTPEGATVLPPSQYGGVVGIAMRYLGVPYVWGGASPATGFDCSGFIMYVYAQLGLSLPHYTGAQYALGAPVPRDQLQPGDLVFFDGLGHAGIYVGNDQFIHAPHTGDVVKISSMTGSYAANWVGARRLLG